MANASLHGNLDCDLCSWKDDWSSSDPMGDIRAGVRGKSLEELCGNSNFTLDMARSQFVSELISLCILVVRCVFR